MSIARVLLPVASNATVAPVAFHRCRDVFCKRWKKTSSRYTSAPLAFTTFAQSSFFTMFTRGMLNGIHCTASDLKAAIAFRFVLVVGTSFQDWLVHLSPFGDASGKRAACGHQCLAAS